MSWSIWTIIPVEFTSRLADLLLKCIQVHESLLYALLHSC